MKLYTIQPLSVYALLCQEGLFHSRPLAHPDSSLNALDGQFEFTLAYDWLMAKMMARGLPRPHPEIYPIWAYYRWMGVKRSKPDLRSSAVKLPPEQGRRVLMTVDIPEERVLLSDFFGWHSCLNYWHAGPVKASNAFYRRTRKACPTWDYSGPLPDPFHQEVVASWAVVLDLAASRRIQHSRKDDQIIQATFWELWAEEVTEAVAFGGGELRQRLPTPRQVRSSGS